MAVTIRDIARAAGVSIATVSKVVNGNDSDISSDTREKVLSIVSKYGYSPNSAARSLRTKRSYTIGFVLPDYDSPMYPPLLKGVDQCLRGRGYTLLCYSSDNDMHQQIHGVKLLATRLIDGLIINRIHEEDLSEVLSDIDIPTVSIDRVPLPVPAGVGQVYIDARASLIQCVDMLVQKGCKKIALVCNSKGRAGVRFSAYKEALERAGLEFDENLIYEGPSTFEGGRHGAELLLEYSDVDGMICGNDLVSEGAMATLVSRNLSISDDVRVLATDVVYLSSPHNRAFTCMRQPTYELGRVAADMLLEHLIDGRDLSKVEIEPQFYAGTIS